MTFFSIYFLFANFGRKGWFFEMLFFVWMQLWSVNETRLGVLGRVLLWRYSILLLLKTLSNPSHLVLLGHLHFRKWNVLPLRRKLSSVLSNNCDCHCSNFYRLFSKMRTVLILCVFRKLSRARHPRFFFRLAKKIKIVATRFRPNISGSQLLPKQRTARCAEYMLKRGILCQPSSPAKRVASRRHV